MNKTLTILEHDTDFDSAEKILWYLRIFGGLSDSKSSHERRPHFHMEGQPKAYNYSSKTLKITLRFATDLPRKVVEGVEHHPIGGVVNEHWRDGALWQATVDPDHNLIFIGVAHLDRTAGEPKGTSAFLSRLIKLRTNEPVVTALQPPGTVPIPEQPFGLRRFIFAATGRWGPVR